MKKEETKKQKLTRSYTLDSDILEEFEYIADEENLNKSAVVNSLLKIYLEEKRVKQ